MNRGQRAPTEVQICKTEPEKLLLRREREMEASAPHGHSRCGLRPRNLQTGAGAPWADSNVYLGKNYQKVRAGVVSVEMADTVVPGTCTRARVGVGAGAGAGEGGLHRAQCRKPRFGPRPPQFREVRQLIRLRCWSARTASAPHSQPTHRRRRDATPRSSQSPPNCRVAAPAPGLVLSGPGRREHSARHRGCGPETRPAAR